MYLMCRIHLSNIKPILKEGMMSFKYFPIFFIITMPFATLWKQPFRGIYLPESLAHHRLGFPMPSILFGFISDELHTNQERALANRTLVPRRKRLWKFRRMSLPTWKKNLILVQLETRWGQNRHLSLWFLSWVPRLVSLQAASFQGEKP